MLNTIANKYINAKNLQYLVSKDIGYVVLGLAISADDNLFWGVVKNIFGFFGRNLTFPEDNYYYMLGKTAGDAIFLAGFLQTAGYATIDVGKSLLAAGGFAVGGLILAPTIVGGGVCESVAGVELIEAGVMFIVGCAAGAEAAHSTDLLKSDAGKLSEIKDESNPLSNDVIKQLEDAPIETKLNKVTEQMEPYMKQVLGDDYKLILRRDIGEGFSHGDLDHWNIEVQTSQGNIKFDRHLYVDAEGNIQKIVDYIPQRKGKPIVNVVFDNTIK